MFLFYYDEVKYHPPIQPAFWLGGIGIDESQAFYVEACVNDLAKEVFGSSLLERGNEFHGIEIVQGKGAFKGVPLERRIEVLNLILKVIASSEVSRFYVKILPENLVATSDPPAEIAFMFYVERVNRFLEGKKSLGMIFGDYDEPIVGKSVVSLSNFKSRGTYWRKAATIDRLIDTVHFAKSHHSRLIQLADVYLYALQFYSFSIKGNWRDRINFTIRDSGILSPTDCKVWPQEKQWFR